MSDDDQPAAEAEMNRLMLATLMNAALDKLIRNNVLVVPEVAPENEPKK